MGQDGTGVGARLVASGWDQTGAGTRLGAEVLPRGYPLTGMGY